MLRGLRQFALVGAVRNVERLGAVEMAVGIE
jgi:hypothetical protein